MVRRVVREVHGRQEFFPIEGVVVDVGSQIFYDAFVEIFDLGIALWMSRSCLGPFNVPQSPKFIGQFVAEFLATVGMDLFWSGETVYPVVQNVGGDRCGFFIRYGHYHGDFGEGVGHAQNMSVAAV